MVTLPWCIHRKDEKQSSSVLEAIQAWRPATPSVLYEIILSLENESEAGMLGLRESQPEQQFAFKDLMIHLILQFTLHIAFRGVLHRCGNQEIHRWKVNLLVLIFVAQDVLRPYASSAGWWFGLKKKCVKFCRADDRTTLDGFSRREPPARFNIRGGKFFVF